MLFAGKITQHRTACHALIQINHQCRARHERANAVLDFPYIISHFSFAIGDPNRGACLSMKNER
jgi:hypothetical protein